MHTRRLRSLVALVLLTAFASAQQPLSAGALRGHVATLASDTLAGRETGSAGGLAAAHYIAGVLAGAGCEPGGDDDGFFQDIDQDGTSRTGPALLEVQAADGSRRAAAHGVEWRLLRGWASQADLSVLVVSSREAMPAEPDPSVALVLDGSVRSSFSWLGPERGAGWGAVVLIGESTPGEAGEPPRHMVGRDGERVLLMVRGQLAAELAAGDHARLHLSMPVGAAIPALNVVGVLPGVGTPDDPTLADEVVVLTAHYDHLGSHDAAEGEDGIFNGADDDASGVAAVLELARAFAAGPPPARTLVFLLVTGEEHGLLGTYAWLDAPTLPLEQVVCNVNFEMLGRPDPAVGGPGRMWLTGHGFSSLGPAWSASGLAIDADPHPEQNFFRRSDNWAFVERGIVAQTVSSYNLHEEYHSPADELETLDFGHLAAGVAASFQGVGALADGSLRPDWLPGAPVPGAPPAEGEGEGEAHAR